MKIQLACAFACCTAVLAALPLAAQQKLTLHHHDAAHQPPGTIVIPAADFLANIPAGDSNDGRFPAGTWFFNNSTVNMSVADDLVATEPVKEAGVYHLFVRSVGTPTSSFKVKIDGKEDAGSYGQGPVAWVRGGDFTLKPGNIEVRLTSITPRPSINVMVLTKNADFKEDDLKALELPPEVKLLHEYTIANSNIVKFGMWMAAGSTPLSISPMTTRRLCMQMTGTSCGAGRRRRRLRAIRAAMRRRAFCGTFTTPGATNWRTGARARTGRNGSCWRTGGPVR